MDFKRRLSLVVAIMSIALGSGHLVQNVLSKHTEVASDLIKPVDIMLVAAGPEIAAPVKNRPLPQKSAPSFAIAEVDAAPSLFALPADPVMPAHLNATAAKAAAPVLTPSCPVTLDLTALPSAMIGIVLQAPCHTDQRVVLRHAGLAVTGKTSGAGSLELSLPAFASLAQVSARFSDDTVVEATLNLPEADRMRRFGVQWSGNDAFQLNAFENGAGYGETGHVSAADAQRPLAGQPQVGGFLSVLGDDQVSLPMLAEVYTYPEDENTPVRIVIEAAITKGTCAREILGETLADAGGDVTITDLTLAMPDCTAVGDILVLKNLDPDLKIASAN